MAISGAGPSVVIRWKKQYLADIIGGFLVNLCKGLK
jgi:homoserine kinase